MRPALQGDWQTSNIQDGKARVIPMHQSYSADQMERIKLGLIPHGMEDKWFIYWDGDRLHLHRSWTGICVYVAKFIGVAEGGNLVELVINTDAYEEAPTDDQHKATLTFLIDVLLLGLMEKHPGTSMFFALGVIPCLLPVTRGDHPEKAPITFYRYFPDSDRVELIQGVLPDVFNAAEHHDPTCGNQPTAYAYRPDRDPQVRRTPFVPKSYAKKRAAAEQYANQLAAGGADADEITKAGSFARIMARKEEAQKEQK